MNRRGISPAEVKRAIQGVTSAGLTVLRIEIEPLLQRIIVFPTADPPTAANDLDHELADWRRNASSS